MNQWQQEGQARFLLGDAFYRPQTKLVRDLGVLALRVERHTKSSLRVMDALAGCGVRSLRYLQEGGADFAWVNEGNPQNKSLLETNLRANLSPDQYRLTLANAHHGFFRCAQERDYYDLVDVDCFGSAAPFMDSSLWAVKWGGLLYLTSTDGRTLGGQQSLQSLRAYGVYGRSHPGCQGQALRMVLGRLQQQAASRGWGIQPLFSLFTGQTYRVMVRLEPKVILTEDNYGFLGYCHHCGNYQRLPWRSLSRGSCHCGDPQVVASGPLWLGPLHDGQFVTQMQTQAIPWRSSSLDNLLGTMAAEASPTLPPYYFTLGELGKRGKLDLPKKELLLAALNHSGYESRATAILAQAIRTTAPMEVCIQLCRQIQG